MLKQEHFYLYFTTFKCWQKITDNKQQSPRRKATLSLYLYLYIILQNFVVVLVFLYIYK